MLYIFNEWIKFITCYLGFIGSLVYLGLTFGVILAGYIFNIYTPKYFVSISILITYIHLFLFVLEDFYVVFSSFLYYLFSCLGWSIWSLWISYNLVKLFIIRSCLWNNDRLLYMLKQLELNCLVIGEMVFIFKYFF